MTYNIALLPGDGIGVEVIDATRVLLEDAADTGGFSIKTTRYDWSSERYIQQGSMMPEDAIETLEAHDAILLGAVGHPKVPDHITLHGMMLPIRKAFNQQVCKRPSVLFDGVESPLRDYDGGDIDFVVYRENTEGEYSDAGGHEHQGYPHEVAVQTAIYTRRGTEVIVRAAFEEAVIRDGHLTNVTKSNAQAHGMVFWDQIVEEVAAEYPSVTVERLLVDAASMDLVRRPDEFDVIVASNLFGDILTDIGAIISGSMGLAPSANINVEGHSPSMFEPVHGSAPDIAGEGIANPLASVLSISMLFDHIGEKRVANDLWRTVETQLTDTDAPRTPDLGGTSSTEAVISDLRTRL